MLTNSMIRSTAATGTDSWLLMTEHPAWCATEQGRHRVFAPADGPRRLVVVEADGPVTLASTGQLAPLDVTTFELTGDAVRDVPELQASLTELGMVMRIANPDLWDAIGTAIMRQVIRAPHAATLYRRFCDHFGKKVTLPDGETFALFPTPQTVLALSDDDFAFTGTTFKRPALRAAAQAYLDNGDRWQHLAPETLIAALQQVPRIGPWTAHAAVVDWSNQYELYPADLAVRTWAAKAAPNTPWPDNDKAFSERWTEVAGQHLSTVTLLTLAWGNHHGDHTRP